MTELPDYADLPPAPNGGRSGWGLFGAVSFAFTDGGHRAAFFLWSVLFGALALAQPALADKVLRLNIVADPAMIDAMLRDGARRAAAIADPIVAQTEDLVGFLRV